MIEADLYDFDKTVFKGETGSKFFIFCLKKKPSLIKYAPRFICALFKHYVIKTLSMEKMKDELYCFLSEIDGEKATDEFWEQNAEKMNPWFKPRENDVKTVVCSASPAFQIKPICEKFGVDVIIATDMDVKTGKVLGMNCKGEEKVRRLRRDASEYVFRDVYTDNIKSDAPMLSLAQRHQYRVKHGNVSKIKSVGS